MKVTNQQIRRISYLLRVANLESQKETLVLSFSNGRTESRAGLRFSEAAELIAYLQKEANELDTANRMRRKLIAKCHNLGWETTPGTADMERLNNWCKTKGYLKKELMDYTATELPKLVSQFDKVYVSIMQKVSKPLFLKP